MSTCVTKEVPVPVVEVFSAFELLHLIDRDGPADKVDYEEHSVVPVPVAVEFLIQHFDLLLNRLKFLTI